MNFLFDANLPFALAHAMAALSKAEEGLGTIKHLTDLFPPATPDLEWIPGLARHGDEWYIVSQDKFRKSRGAEREALRRAGHGVYVLEPSWSSQPYWAKAAQLVKWWPRILEQARLTSGSVLAVPWTYSQAKRFKSM